MPDSDKKPAAQVETLPLEALAKMFGQVNSPGVVHGDKYKSDHACAAARHGWNVQEYNYGPLSMSVVDYVEALKAAAKGSVHSPVCFRKARKV